MNKTTYLDYAAATPMDPAVLEAMQPYFSIDFYNPSATYLPAQKVAKDIEAARSQVAGLLGVKPSELYFVAGGTEANNLAIHGVMQQYPNGHMIVSAIEHESVLKPAEDYRHTLAPCGTDGIVDVKALEKAVKDDTVLISIMYANNEIGTVQPLREIAEIVEKARKIRITKGNETPLYFHTDACQAGAYLDIHANRLGLDMMSLNGGKIYGPKQSGVLFVKAGIVLRSQITGGGQESGLRSGTENVPAIIGFAKALELAQRNRQEETKRLSSLQQLFIDQLKEKIPIAVINGSLKRRLPNNVHLTISGYDNERLLLELEEKGILAAAGSACSASSEEPSHVLKAIGVSGKDAQASLRFSAGKLTTQKDVIHAVNSLAACL